MINITLPLAIPNPKSSVAPGISDTVHVTLFNHPFRNIRIATELRAGDSVAEILRRIGCRADLPARIFLGDAMVSGCQREHVYPAPGELLTVRAIPAGGGGSKDVEILTIVIAAVASIAAGQFEAWALATPQFLSLSAIGQEAFTGALTAAIKFGGTQLINALIPPPRTPVPKQETTPHSYTVSGTANAAAPFSPIPKLYGQRRIFPQYAASPYNELVGFNQYLRMLFLLGYGPLDISQIKIGDTAIEDYEDVEWELRSGFPDDAPTRLYPGSVANRNDTTGDVADRRLRCTAPNYAVKEAPNFLRSQRSLLPPLLPRVVQTLEPNLCILADRSFLVGRTEAEAPSLCDCNPFSSAPKMKLCSPDSSRRIAGGRYRHLLAAFETKTERTQRTLQVR